MNRKVFFDIVRKSFGRLKQRQVEGIERILDYRKASWPKMPTEELAYVLATVKWETGNSFQPVEEGYPQRGEALRAYQRGLRYWPAYGRGLVQLTWPKNYARLGLNDPSEYPKALEWSYALRALFEGMIFGWFTGRKLADYISPERQDYVGARAVVNGNDRAETIAGYATRFLAALRAGEVEVGVEVEEDEPKVSTGAKVGGGIAGGGVIVAGGAAASGGDETTSAILAGLSALAGLATWLAPKVKDWVMQAKPEMPTPKPQPPDGELVQPLEVTVSTTPALDAAVADARALRSQLDAALERVADELQKARERSDSFNAAIASAKAEANLIRALTPPVLAEPGEQTRPTKLVAKPTSEAKA